MNILDNLIIFSLIVLAFLAGITTANRYNAKAKLEVKEALEKQFLRLKVHADADDPVKPYGTPQVVPIKPIPVKYNTGDYDGDNLITPQFMEELRTNGRARTTLRKTK